MDQPRSTESRSPQEILKKVMDLCADCDTCRTLMDVDCAFFPEIYRLWDKMKDGGIPVDDSQLRGLVELCTLCGLCPCPKIPIEIIEAKSRYIEEEGLPLATRLLTDVPRMARLCGSFPKLFDIVQSSRTLGPLVRKAARLHPERQLPGFPKESFFRWADKRGLTTRKEGGRTVSYFAGCTAGYLFPQVGRAVVKLLEHNGVNVHVPPQRCCGMPHLAEGAREATLRSAQFNMGHLLEATREGDDLVSSCPTCGIFMKVLLKERAYYSEAYQRSVGAGADEMKVPDPAQGARHKILKKSMYKDILKDDGYFSSLNPLDRIDLAVHLFDAGEYLARLQAEGRLDTTFEAIPERMVYFAPCHQREQKIGRPYLDLLALIPELTVEPVGDTECCGMGGNFGFKEDFHETSLALGRPIIEKIRARAPQAILTDCMSCRLQFSHTLPYPVFHPLEIMAKGCRKPAPK